MRARCWACCGRGARHGVGCSAGCGVSMVQVVVRTQCWAQCGVQCGVRCGCSASVVHNAGHSAGHSAGQGAWCGANAVWMYCTHRCVIIVAEEPPVGQRAGSRLAVFFLNLRSELSAACHNTTAQCYCWWRETQKEPFVSWEKGTRHSHAIPPCEVKEERKWQGGSWYSIFCGRGKHAGKRER